jgi:DNA-directed RNA polymerase specialized sigma24 family protein
MNGVSTFQLECGQRVGRPDPVGHEELRKRIALLDRRDQLLVELSINLGASQRKIAELTGSDAGTVCRRLRRIWQRLADPVVTRLLDPRCPLGPEYRQVGIERFLAGRSAAAIAEARGMPLREVRELVRYVKSWHRFTRGGIGASGAGRAL